MTPTTAATTLFQRWADKSLVPSHKEACEMAIAALQKEALMLEAIEKSGGKVLIVEHITDEQGMWYVVSIHGGATIAARSVVEALTGLMGEIDGEVKT
mgnify:FL=1